MIENGIVICDAPGCEVEVDCGSFHGAVEHKKEWGWKSIKSKNGTWFEICPDCAEDFEIIRSLKSR